MTALILLTSMLIGSEPTDIVKLTNTERTTRNLQPLMVNDKLMKAAQDYAELMATKQVLSHNIVSLTKRLDRVGYQWSMAGENIAMGYSDADSVVKGWMHSPGHRSNILNKGYKDIGVGVAADKNGRKYHCQIFGESR